MCGHCRNNSWRYNTIIGWGLKYNFSMAEECPGQPGQPRRLGVPPIRIKMRIEEARLLQQRTIFMIWPGKKPGSSLNIAGLLSHAFGGRAEPRDCGAAAPISRRILLVLYRTFVYKLWRKNSMSGPYIPIFRPLYSRLFSSYRQDRLPCFLHPIPRA